MKRLVLFVLFSSLLIVCTTGCGEETTDVELNKEDDLIGYLEAANEVLYVKPEFRDTVLAVLLAEETIEDSTTIHVIETFLPMGFTYFYDSLWVDTTDHYYPHYGSFKVYNNSDCNKVHPGFTSECIGTFGEHRIWGRSMRWIVNEWKSCTAGSSICIETYERIGEIQYFSNIDCMMTDTLVFTRGIYEWTCIK